MTDVATAAPATGEVLSIYEAAERLGKPRPEPKADTGDDAAPRAPAADESAGDETAVAAPPQEAPGETEGDIDPVSEPPLDAPRSWPKAEKGVFKSLPRETQQKLLEIDRERDRELRNGQREAAEQRKAAEATKQAAEQAKQQYESALPQLAQLLTAQHGNQFADIKSWDDVDRLRQKDPARYLAWDASQKRMTAVQAEAQKTNAAKRAEAQKWFDSFVTDEDAKFIEAAPEYADPKKAPQLQAANIETLTDLGFQQAEIEDLMMGKKPLLARDHRVQLLVRDATRWRQAQKAAAAAKAKPIPPVIRAGVAPDKGGAQVAKVQEAQKQLARSGKVDDAVALIRARRAS